MASFATIEHLEDLWRPLTVTEIVTATAYLEMASRLIRASVPSLDARIAAGKVDADLAADITAMMTKRALQNPEGARSTTESLDGATLSVSYDQAVSTGMLYIDAAELAVLSRTPSTFSIRTLPEPTTQAQLETIAQQRNRW